MKYLTFVELTTLPISEQLTYRPVAGALCSDGFQELTPEQIVTYQNSKVTAAIRFKKNTKIYSEQEVVCMLNAVKEKCVSRLKEAHDMASGDLYDTSIELDYINPSEFLMKPESNLPEQL